MKIDTFKPKIFPIDKIICGVSKRMADEFPPDGFSVHPADIYSQETANKHLEMLALYCGVDKGKLKCNKQTHSSRIVVMNPDTALGEADGVIIREKGIFAYVKLADCTGILLYDPENSIVSAIHSGWRGTKLNIAGECISILSNEFSVNPEKILAYISPSASGRNYKVGNDVAIHFPGYTKAIGNSKYLFDNPAKIVSQLIEAGLQRVNIEVSEVCTIENTDCHSFRRDGVKSGRMACFIGMI